MSCDGLGHVDLPELDPALAGPEPGATPVPGPGSRPVPAPDDPGSAPVPAPGTAPVPAGSGTALELVPDLVQLPARLPLMVIIWHWVRRQAPSIPGTLLAIPRKVKTHRPGTWQDHTDYIGARAWMQWANEGRYEYLEGWLRTFIIRTSKWGGIVYGCTLGKVFILAGAWLIEMGHRQSRFWLTALAFTVLVAVWKLQHILFS